MSLWDGFDYRKSGSGIATSSPFRSERDPVIDHPSFFTLQADGVTPQPEPDVAKWHIFIAHSPLVLLKRELLADDTLVSTVFTGAGRDTLWQTAVIRKDGELEALHHFSNYHVAKAGHQAVVEHTKLRVDHERAIRLREP